MKNITNLKSILTKKQRSMHILPVFVLVIVFLIFSSHAAHAQEIGKMFGLDLASLISESLANFFYTLQTIASWLITLSGALLNFSINLTMHIKEFVNATPTIYTVWTAIRDISGMFIIFALLYAAIMLIIGYQNPKLGDLIKNIVVAGVLINFSFFITGLAIDASNVVSLQLYSALAPTQSVSTNSGDLKTDISASIKNPGLANIFMQSLGITRLYSPGGTLNSTGQKANGSWSVPIKIIIIGITSIIIMVTAALSFFLASLAFIVRFVILLFLLAFSPIVFASFVVPKIGEYSKKWLDMLKSQLFFMPAYLLLMYFALSVLTSSSIFKNGYAGSLVAGGDFASDLLAIGVNATLVIVMLNIPLVVAITLGAKVPGFAKNLDALSIWKKVGGFTGRSTVGQAGYATEKFLQKHAPTLSNTAVGQSIIKNTAGRAANATWGGGTSAASAAAATKQRSAAGQTAVRNRRNSNDLQKAISSGNPGQVRAMLNRMTTNEKVQLDKKIISHDLVLQHLDEGVFKAIDNSSNTNLTDADKAKIQDDRMTLLTSSVLGGNTPVIQNMLKYASGSTLAKLEDPNITNGVATLQDPRFITHLRAGHLKDMDHIDPGIRKVIGDYIYLTPLAGPTGGTHPAFDYVDKNRGTWG